MFNGVCAVVCGGFMMAGAAGILPPAFDELFGFFDLMVPLIQRMPLPAYMTADLFWPGLALALVNGVANLVASVLFARSDGRARSWALLAGALLIVSVIYLVIGLVQTACAAVMHPAR